MNLDAYMAAQKYTDKSFGEQIGRSRLQVFKYRHGKAVPRKPVIDKITEVTAGQVTASDFYTSTDLQ